MRIRIEVQSALGKFILPQGYNPYVQGLVNACIPEDIKWSGIATGTEEAHFKLFTFSQLYAKSVERIDIAPHEKDGGDAHVHYQLVMSSPVWFYLSSPSPEFVEALIPRLEQAHDLHLERNLVQSVHVSVTHPVATPAQGLVTWRVRTISPITVYQSESKDSNSAHYFAPKDPLFSKIVLDNAVRKYYAWTQEKAPSDGFSISCLDKTPHLAVISFKDTPILGYTGRFQLTGDARLLSFLYESGLGGKNSHGFGMFDIAPEGEDDAHWRRRTEEESREVHSRPSASMTAADQERPDRRDGPHHGGREEPPSYKEHGNTTSEHNPSRSPGSGDDRVHTSHSQSKSEQSGHPHGDRSPSGHPHTDRPYSDRSRTNHPNSHTSRTEEPRLDGTRSSGRGTGHAGADNRAFQSTSRAGAPDRRAPRSKEEPHRKFVSRYAPDIKPVSHEKAATGSYSIWDGKTKVDLPRFVRPDGTESTGAPRPNQHRPGSRSGASERSSTRDARAQTGRRGESLGAPRPGGSSGSTYRPSGGHGDPRNHGGNKSGPYNH
ncbi:MAG: CRISPR-associated endoribonuclease Cas6 [Candidatus Cryosericum sp.]|nr:CRISPR-associated endoribonuclease Cas6 [bacterium]